MTINNPQTLVSTEWLNHHLNDLDLRIVDASWYLPSANRDPYSDYLQAHIPGAVFFDIDEISDQSSSLPHMVPPVELFASKVSQLGLGDGHEIVVYDTSGVFSAARVWWLFKLMGHNEVSVLDGGYPKWLAEGRVVTDTLPHLSKRHFTVRKQSHLVKSYEEVAKASEECTSVIIDARSSLRFRGLEEEPRKGLRSGNIPNSKNLPFQDLLTNDGTFKEVPELKNTFAEAGIDLAHPVITTCGSGVTAAVLSLALTLMGHDNHSLYDGSWAEWGSK